MDLETKEGTADANHPNTVYATCVGLGFFTGINSSNILVCPLLFEHALPRNRSVIDFLTRVAVFWVSLIASLIFANSLLNIAVFLGAVYGPWLAPVRGDPKKNADAASAV